jgi:beta-glucosidase
MGDREVIVNLPVGKHSLRIEYHGMRERSFLQMGYEHVSAMRTGFDAAIAAAKSADLVVFCGGHTDKSEGEARDRAFAMHPEIERLLLAVTAANSNTVAVITAGGNIDMESWHDKVRAIVYARYPGQEGGTALAEVLSGQVNPSGRLPATFERRLEDRSSFDCYHDPDKDLRVTLSDGVFGGYRHFDRAQGRNAVKPRYPFGFGLSYTTFAYENLQISEGKTLPIVVTCEVVNAGTRAGKTVVQVFVGEKKPSLPRPVKELKGFKKVALEPGERKTVRIELDRRAFAFYDLQKETWTVNPGSFIISICSSAETTELKGLVRLSPGACKERKAKK